MLRVGLTGGIATGKSLVAGYLTELGAQIIDWDAISRIVVESGLPAWWDIVRYFGTGILQADQKIDRSKLGEAVFSDEEKRQKLNSFTHPHIMAEAKRQERAIVGDEPDTVVVHDVPLLFEVGGDKTVDETVVVYATKENQVKRLIARDGMSLEDALSRINAQMPLADKVKQADFVIDNNGSMEETKTQVQELYRELLTLARANK